MYIVVIYPSGTGMLRFKFNSINDAMDFIREVVDHIVEEDKDYSVMIRKEHKEVF